MELALFLTLGLIHLAGLLSPGPDFALVLKNSTELSRKLALCSAMGLAFGVATHATLSITGVSLLIQQSELLFTLLQWTGILYLSWLGVGAIKAAFAKPRSQTSEFKSSKGMWQALSLGYLTNLLNPKALVYFAGMVAALIPAGINYGIKFALILELFLLTLIWFGGLAFALSLPKVQVRIKKAEKGLNFTTGILLLLVAAGLAFRAL